MRGGRQGRAAGAPAFWGAVALAAALCGGVGARVPGGLAAVGGAWRAPSEVLGDRRSLLFTGDYVAPPDRDFGDAGKRLLGAGSGDKGKKTKKKKKNRKVRRRNVPRPRRWYCVWLC